MQAWSQTAAGPTYVIYDGMLPICELDGSGTVSAVNTFGENGLLSRHTSAGSRFYTFDPQGSTSQRLDPSGNPIATGTFDAFGTGNSTGSPDPFGYGAQWTYRT